MSDPVLFLAKEKENETGRKIEISIMSQFLTAYQKIDSIFSSDPPPKKQMTFY